MFTERALDMMIDNRYDEALSCLPKRQDATDDLEELLLVAECQHHLEKVTEAEETVACFDECVLRCGKSWEKLSQWGDEVSARGRHLGALIIYRSVNQKYCSGKPADNVDLHYFLLLKMYVVAFEMVQAGGLSRQNVSKLVITWMEEVAIQLEVQECVHTGRKNITFDKCLCLISLLHHSIDSFEEAMRYCLYAIAAVMNRVRRPDYISTSDAVFIFCEMSVACRARIEDVPADTFRMFAIEELKRATDFVDEWTRQECLKILRQRNQRRDVMQ